MPIANDSLTKFWQCQRDNQLDRQVALDILKEHGNDPELALEALQKLESPPEPVISEDATAQEDIDAWFPRQEQGKLFDDSDTVEQPQSEHYKHEAA